MRGINQVPKKKKLAIFTATGGRGCENAILDIHYQVASLARWADISFWPYVLGSHWENLEAQEVIDVCFFSGAARTESDREAGMKLRQKSQIMVACGACAAFGGMPGLTNLSHAKFETGNAESKDSNSEIDLPRIESRVSGLAQIVEVDYFVPGCPPSQNFLWGAMQALVCEGKSPTRISFSASRLPEVVAQAAISGAQLPKGSIFAVGVEDASSDIRIGDDVVVLRNDELIGVGVAVMSPEEMIESDRGEAIRIRHLVKPKDKN